MSALSCKPIRKCCFFHPVVRRFSGIVCTRKFPHHFIFVCLILQSFCIIRDAVYDGQYKYVCVCVCMCVCVCVYVCVCVCIHVGTGALHRPVRHKACRRPHAPLEPRVAGELLWLSVGGRLTGVYQGNVTGQHPAEPSSLCPDCHQVP